MLNRRPTGAPSAIEAGTSILPSCAACTDSGPFSGGAAREFVERLPELRRRSGTGAVDRGPSAQVRRGLPVAREPSCRPRRRIERLCADALVDAEGRIEARIAERVPPVLRSDGTARPTGFLRPNFRLGAGGCAPNHRLWQTEVFVPPAGRVPRRRRLSCRAATATPERRAVGARRHRCRPQAADPRPVLTTGLAERGSPSTRAGAGWPPRRGPVRSPAGSIEDSVLRVERTASRRAGRGRRLGRRPLPEVVAPSCSRAPSAILAPDPPRP